jgi:hypothetical protein
VKAVRNPATTPINWGPVAAVPLSTYAPNGVINILNGDLYIQGTVKGRVTLAATQSTTGGSNGRVFIENDFVYSQDPRTNPNSTDLVGVVAYGDIQVNDNGATKFNVMGSMYSYQGGFSVENLDSRPSGVLTLVGGMIVEYLRATSNGGTGSARRGYNLSLQYDKRLVGAAPPVFPATGLLEVISWFE